MEILSSPASLLQILFVRVLADPTNTKTRCEIFSKLTIKTQNDYNDVVLASLLFNLNKFHKLFWCVRCWLETRNFRQGVEEVNCRNLFLTCKICSALTLKIFLFRPSMENFLKSQGEMNLFWLYLLLIQPRLHLYFILKNQFCRWSLDSTFFMLN